jgi:hypothetical protein
MRPIVAVVLLAAIFWITRRMLSAHRRKRENQSMRAYLMRLSQAGE